MTLTATGFDRPRLADTKTEIDQSMTDVLGPVNTNADAVVGQIDGIWAEGVDNLYENLQDVYDSQYPFSAEGTSLDGAVAYIGLSRLDATATTVTAAAYGTEGTLIPAGALASADIQYSSTSDVIISRANALDVSIQVNSIVDSTVYNILAGGQSIVFTSGISATASEILAGLAALFNTAIFVATSDGTTLRVYSLDGVTPFSITVDTKLTITKRGSPVVFVAASTGANAVPAGALANIDTPIFGWDSVLNLVAGDIGRNVETDTELRLRHASSVRATGSATVEAIKARMLAEVASVTSVQIYENRTNITSSDGLPSHSFETVVKGGNNQSIADQLWLTKPAGIETYGNVSVNVTDSAGDVQLVRFSRSVTKYAWIRVTVTALNAEEPLPTTAVSAIQSAVVTYGQDNIGVGDDIVLQRFFGPIYTDVTGIGSMTIEGAITASPSDTPAYGTSNIVIGRSETAEFDASRVIVMGI
jgi:uncharacterized phage protein gp47/JayE